MNYMRWTPAEHDVRSQPLLSLRLPVSRRLITGSATCSTRGTNLHKRTLFHNRTFETEHGTQEADSSSSQLCVWAYQNHGTPIYIHTLLTL